MIKILLWVLIGYIVYQFYQRQKLLKTKKPSDQIQTDEDYVDYEEIE